MKKTIFIFILTIGIAYPLAAQSTFTEFADSTETWYNARVNNAKRKIKEMVEMPLFVRSTGWGCTCPYYYIGIENNTGGGLWVSPIIPKDFPVTDSIGHSLIVKGYFTGKLEKEAGDDTIIYHVPLFKIIFWKNNENPDSTSAPRVIK